MKPKLNNLAVVLSNKNSKMELLLLKQNLKYIKFIELRADMFYPDLELVHKMLKHLSSFNKKIILTFRSVLEGGKIKVSNTKIFDFISTILSQNSNNIDYLDIELLSKNKTKLVQLAKKYDKKIIFSSHLINVNEKYNISRIKSLIPKILSLKKNGNIIKIVSKTDNFKNYFETLKQLFKSKQLHQKYPVTFFTIGKTSLISRLIGIILNMPIIFVSLTKPVIKSQPDIKSILKNLEKLGFL